MNMKCIAMILLISLPSAMMAMQSQAADTGASARKSRGAGSTDKQELVPNAGRDEPLDQETLDDLAMKCQEGTLTMAAVAHVTTKNYAVNSKRFKTLLEAFETKFDE